MRKIDRHVATSTSQPPRNGPIPAATPPRPDHAPIARGRSWAANDAWMIARLPGVSRAPPTPCKARAPISSSEVGAAAHSTEATVNHAAPMTKMRRRPIRSPSEPPRRMKAARLNV